jgi:thiol-disulfide isomerase/thioredoxin
MLNKDSFLFVFDKNANWNFEDDTVVKFILNEKKILNFELLTDKEKYFNIRAEVKVTIENNELGLKFRPLIKYKIESPIQAFIYPNNFMTNIVIYPNRYKDKEIPKVFYPNEFIPIDTGWCTIENIDFISKTAFLTLYSKETKPIGSRVGYYTDLHKIKNTVNSYFERIEKWKKSNANFTLFHFWGPWCAPCRAEFKTVMNIEKFLNDSNIDLIHFSVCFNENDKIKTNEFIEKKAITEIQNIIMFKESFKPLVNQYREGNSVLQILDQMEYPNYILISPEGKILYRGKYSESLIEQIKKVKKY